MDNIERQNEAVRNWADLIEALTLLSKHPMGSDPVHPGHDVLTVMADPEAFEPEEIEKLERLGFLVSKEYGNFFSYRFGSA